MVIAERHSAYERIIDSTKSKISGFEIMVFSHLLSGV
jgi:hypothetical protein